MCDKTYAFIDGQNLYLGITDMGWELNYKKFFVYLKEKYKVDRAFIYLGYIKSYHKLYEYLSNCGFNVKFKKVTTYNSTVKGNVDVLLTVDAIRKSRQYDKGLFISADGDFLPLYNYLTKEKRKQLLLLIPDQRRYSKLLLDYKSKLRFMNDLKSKLEK